MMKQIFIIAAVIALALAGPLALGDEQRNAAWLGGLKQHFFGDREIAPAADAISLELPDRAEDGAAVPVRIRAAFPQTPERYIQTLTVLIDRNPTPLGGIFRFTPNSGQVDLSFRIRVNEYSQVRAIAETNDGKLLMASHYVKASGGCSAPVGTDLEAAAKRLGKIRFKTTDASPDGPVQMQLAVSHPNLTGLQKDQLSLLFIPAHFVQKVEVKFEGEPVFSAETDISISENPNFRFYFVPRKPGKLTAEISDSKGMKFTETYTYPAGG